MSFVPRSLALIVAVALSLPACDSLMSDGGLGEIAGVDLSELTKLDVGGLKDKLMEVVRDQLDARGLSIPSSVDKLLEDFVGGGAQSLSDEGVTENGWTTAVKNIRSFMQKLMDGSSADANGLLDVTPDSFRSLVDSVCPLEPFCR